MAKYGYARVSSLSQSTDVQVKALQDAGCTVVRTEKLSGSSRDGRDELANILDFLQSSWTSAPSEKVTHRIEQQQQIKKYNNSPLRQIWHYASADIYLFLKNIYI